MDIHDIKYLRDLIAKAPASDIGEGILSALNYAIEARDRRVNSMTRRVSNLASQLSMLRSGECLVRIVPLRTYFVDVVLVNADLETNEPLRLVRGCGASYDNTRATMDLAEVPLPLVQSLIEESLKGGPDFPRAITFRYGARRHVMRCDREDEVAHIIEAIRGSVERDIDSKLCVATSNLATEIDDNQITI
jgi:hypothetical protein